MDADDYLRVVGVERGSIDASKPESLKQIYSRHTQTIPFCSLPIMHGVPVDPMLDIAGLADKMLRRRLGGVCFEQAALLCHVLRELGFDAMVLGGEVWRAPWTPPNTHASVLVTFPGGDRYFCDVGYTMRALEPLRLEDGTEQRQSNGRVYKLLWEPREEVAAGAADGSGGGGGGGEGERLVGYWVLEMFLQGNWTRHHRFRPQPRGQPDFEGPARWLSTTESPFMNGWVLSICRPNGAHVTLATGRLAGGPVPDGTAKYVVRQLEQATDEDSTVSTKAVVRHHERFIPVDSDEVRRMVAEEFKADWVFPKASA